MKAIGFPDWAPDELIEAYETLNRIIANRPTEAEEGVTYDIDYVQSRATTLNTLITQDIMESVWRKLMAREAKLRPLSRSSDSGVLSFSSTVWVALHHRSPWERLTPKERIKKLAELVKDLRRVAGAAKRYQLGNNIVSLFNDNEITGLQLYLTGYGLAGPERIKEALENLPTPPEAGTPSIIMNAPPIDELLLRLACSIESSPPLSDCVLYKPGASNSDLVYFVRKLSEHNIQHYGLSLYKIIADTASLFFPDYAPTEHTVRDMLLRS